jgi:hypothetical protein
MASNNRLLGMNTPEVIQETIKPEQLFAPAWVYHPELLPEGKIVYTDLELKKHDDAGWDRLPPAYIEKFGRDKDIVLPKIKKELPPEIIKEAREAEVIKAESEKLDKSLATPKDLASFECDVCGKVMDSARSLLAHKMGAHRRKK